MPRGTSFGTYGVTIFMTNFCTGGSFDKAGIFGACPAIVLTIPSAESYSKHPDVSPNFDTKLYVLPSSEPPSAEAPNSAVAAAHSVLIQTPETGSISK